MSVFRKVIWIEANQGTEWQFHDHKESEEGRGRIYIYSLVLNPSLNIVLPPIATETLFGEMHGVACPLRPRNLPIAAIYAKFRELLFEYINMYYSTLTTLPTFGSFPAIAHLSRGELTRARPIPLHNSYSKPTRDYYLKNIYYLICNMNHLQCHRFHGYRL